MLLGPCLPQRVRQGGQLEATWTLNASPEESGHNITRRSLPSCNIYPPHHVNDSVPVPRRRLRLATPSHHTIPESVDPNDATDPFDKHPKRRKHGSHQKGGANTERETMSLPEVSVVKSDSLGSSSTGRGRPRRTASQMAMPPPPLPPTEGRVTRRSTRQAPGETRAADTTPSTSGVTKGARKSNARR